jgi:Tfp pilus assembly protein PilP
MRRLALSFALIAAIGCEKTATGPTTAEFNQDREALKNRTAEKKARTAPGAARVAKASAPAGPAGSMGAVDASFAYDGTGKRDPFRSFLLDKAERAEGEVEGPLEKFDLAQLSLEAVIWQTGNARALIADPSGETYIVAEGARIGKNEGRVIGIEDGLVRVKETYVDYLGRETTKDIEMRMRRNEGG